MFRRKLLDLNNINRKEAVKEVTNQKMSVLEGANIEHLNGFTQTLGMEERLDVMKTASEVRIPQSGYFGNDSLIIEGG